MTIPGRSGSSSGPRWIKWTKYAAVGVASLAVLTSSASVAQAANPAVAFRGQHVSAYEYQAQARQEAEAARMFSVAQHDSRRRLDTNATMNKAVDKANEVGASVRKAVKQMRGGTDKFYHDLITAVKITLCEQLVKENDPIQNPKIRFVDPSSDRAYKDSNGDCYRVEKAPETDPAILTEYDNGRCEVKPNCYWGDVYANKTERSPVYATDQSAQPPPGAMSTTDAKDMIMKWAQGLMIFVVPGIILAVLSLLTMIFFLLCRCCCNRCGGRSPKEGGYTCMQKFLPLLFYLLFAIGVIVVAGVSLLYQKTVMTAVSDTFQAASDTLGNANTWILGIETPLVGVRDTVTTSADKIKVQLAGTDFIKDGLTGLTDRLTTFGEYSADRTLPEGCDTTDKFCTPCTFCTTISTEVAKSTTQITDHADDGVKKLQSVRENLNGMLVDIAGSVQSTVDNQVKTLDSLITTITDVQKQVDDVQSQFEKQKAAQKVGVLAPFALALAVIAIGFVGILFGLTPLKFLANIIHIAYVIGFIALILTFLISAIFLAISVTLGDVCEVTLIFQQDWTVPLGDQAKGINACFTNESLIDAFNLSSQLEFARGGIQFPSNDLSKMLDFSDLDTFAGDIQKTDASTFSYDASKMNALKAQLDALVKQTDTHCYPTDVYTDADIDTPWTANGDTHVAGQTPEQYITARYTAWDATCDYPSNHALAQYACADMANCKYSIAVTEIFHGWRMLTHVKLDAGGFVDELHKNITVVTDYTADFKGKITDLDTKIGFIKTDLQASLIKDVDDFEHAMYCTFLADGYGDIYDALCGKLMPAFTMISFMLFLAGIFLFPVNVCLIIACKRLKARGNGGHVMDNEMKFK